MTNCYVDHFTYMRSPSGLEVASLLGNSMRLSNLHVVGATTLSVTPATTVDLLQYDRITIFDGPNSEVVMVNADTQQPTSSIVIQSPGLQFQHAAGTPCCSDGPLGSLADQLMQASSWWEQDFTYQSLFQATYTGEVLSLPSMQASIDNQRMLVFRPHHFPVTAVSSMVLQAIQSQTMTLDATQAFIDGNQQYVRVPVLNAVGPSSQVFFPQQPFNRTKQQWLTISYTAGYAASALPLDIISAVISLASELLARRQNPTGADQIDFADKHLVQTLRGDQTGESLHLKNARRIAARYKLRSM